jgi:flagellar basal-body rod protein FlgG
MMRALYTAASGMMAQQLNIDNISNNLANIQTTGYKKSRVNFQDLLYAQTGGAQVGMGTRAANTQKLFTQGSTLKTGNPLDVAIGDNGQGFFMVKLPDGQIGYTRDGAFKTTMDPRTGAQVLCTQSGMPLVDESGKPIAIPEGYTNVSIDEQGRVMAYPADAKEPVEVGHLALARFLNPAGLEAKGGNIYAATPEAGQRDIGRPGTGSTFGVLVPEHLEKANINVVEEMMNIVQAQRAFEISQKGVQSADEMMRMTNQMQKG